MHDRLAHDAPRPPRTFRRGAFDDRGFGGIAGRAASPMATSGSIPTPTKRRWLASSTASGNGPRFPSRFSSRTPAARRRRTFRGKAARKFRPSRRTGWRTVAPSPLPMNPNEAAPMALSREELTRLRENFAAAARRAARARTGRRPTAWRAWLPHASVPVAAVEPARRRLRRLARQPHAFPAGGFRRRQGGFSGGPPGDHARLGNGLGRGRLVDRRDLRLRRGAGKARLQRDSRFQRRHRRRRKDTR